MGLLAPLAAAALLATPPPPSPAGPDDVELAGREAGAVRAPSFAGAWGGERTGREPTLSDRVADYRIRAVLDPARHTLEGNEQLTWRNRSAVPIRSLYLHLYLNAFESPGSTLMRERARRGRFRFDVSREKGQWGWIELRSVTQGGKAAAWSYVHPDGGPETDHTVAKVELPEPVPPGGSARLEIDFFDRLPRVVARSGWFGSFHLAGQWYPKVGVLELPGERGAVRPRWNCHEYHLDSEFYADFGSYDLEVVAPPGFAVAASGVRQGAPEPRPGAVAHRFRADDVHDVAFAAWDGFAPPLSARWKGAGSPEVEVQVLHPPEYARQGREALRATLDSLEHFSRTLGPYPYPAVTCVIPPFNAEEAAGMEYETFFTSLASNRFPYDAVTRYVTVHEFGHGYFMGLLASNEFEEPFLDEGMNELWDVRMLAGEALALRLPWPLGLLGLSLPPVAFWEFERLAGTQPFPADPVAGNAWDRWSVGSYAWIYPRTAVAFHDLEQRIGEKAFAAAMQLYYRRWHFRHPGTADLKQAFLDAGADRTTVERFFQSQVYGVEQADDRVVRVEAEEVLPLAGPVWRDGKRVERDEAEVRKEIAERRRAWEKDHGKPAAAKPGPFPWRNLIEARRFRSTELPQTLLVTFEDGSAETFPWPAGERWGRWVLERPVKVRSARIDPEGRWLSDLRKLDDGRTREPRPAAARRLAADAGAWLQLLLALLEIL